MKGDKNGDSQESAHISSTSIYIQGDHVRSNPTFSSQPGQAWRCTVNLDVNTVGNNQVQRDFLDKVQPVKHGNSFASPSTAYAASVAGKIIKSFH